MKIETNIIVSVAIFIVVIGAIIVSCPKTDSKPISTPNIDVEVLETIYHLGYLRGALDANTGNLTADRDKIISKLYYDIDNAQINTK